MTAGTLNPSMLMKSGVALSIRPATKTADGNGDASVDCRGFEWALIYIGLGAVTSGGNGKVVIKSSSDDGSADAFAAITGAEYAITGTDDNTYILAQIRLSNNERYLRADYDETATGSSAVMQVAIIPFGPRSTPEWQTSTFGFTVI